MGQGPLDFTIGATPPSSLQRPETWQARAPDRARHTRARTHARKNVRILTCQKKKPDRMLNIGQIAGIYARKNVRMYVPYVLPDDMSETMSE